MGINKLLGFVLQSASIGLIAALLILILRPQLLDSTQPPTPSQSATATAQTGNPNTTGPASYHAAVEKAAPAVVNVLATRTITLPPNPLLGDPLLRELFSGEIPQQPLVHREETYGSGVILNEHGYILTNNHLVNAADEIRVTLRDGRQTNAKVIGSDPDTDLAVLKVELDNLPTLAIADSTELRIGDVVLAIGNPYGFGQTVTQGIVSATGRKQLGITTFEDFIQTDAAINPGNSGGALVNSRGELIGINSAIISNTGGSQGIGLATPVHIATHVMQELIDKGHVTRGWLGIEAQIIPLGSLPADIATSGVLIAGVFPNGPADSVGLQPGDVIISLLGEPVSDPEGIIRSITRIDPGTSISIKVLRGWKVIEFKPIVAERPTLRRNLP